MRMLALTFLLATCGLPLTAQALPSPDEAPPKNFPRWDEPLAKQRISQAETGREARKTRRDSAAARQERERSQTAYRNASPTEARALMRSHFPDVLDAKLEPGAGLDAGAKVTKRPGPQTALVTEPGQRKPSLVESMLPMQTKDRSGKLAPVSLDLTPTAAGLEPANPLVGLRVAQDARGGITLPDVGVTLRPLGAQASAASLVSGKAIYADTHTDTATIAVPTPGGAETFEELLSTSSPESFAYAVDLPDGAELRSVKAQQDGQPIASAEVVKDGRSIAQIAPPTAFDADREPVPVEMALDGTTLSLTVAHRSKDLSYPILLDPSVTEDFRDWRTTPALDRSGWFEVRKPGFSEPFTGYYGEGPWGNGLHEYSYGTSSAPVFYRDGAFAEWVWQAPGDAFIYKAEFRDVSHSYGYGGSSVVETLFDPNLGIGGSYEPGATYTSGATSAPGPWISSAQYYYDTRTHCSRSNCTPGTEASPSGAKGNEAAAGVLMNGTGYRYASSVVGMGGAAIYLHDFTRPTLDAPTHTNLPSGWVEDGVSDSVASTGRDGGLGVKSFRLQVPGSADRVRTHNCQGDRNDRCPQTLGSSDARVSGDAFSYSTTSMPEGVNTVSLSASDLTDNVSQPTPSSSWSVKVDRSAPDVQLGGDVATADGQIIQGGSWGSTITATDPQPAGTAGSGIKRIETYVNGTLEASKDVTCSPDCPAEASLDGWNFSHGDGAYDIDVRAIDAAGNSSDEDARITVVHATPKASQTLQLDAQPGLRIEGSPGETAGSSIANVGDVNGDDREDLLIGAPGADGGTGAAYLVFGSDDESPITLSATSSSRYLRFTGGLAGDRAGASVAAGGDINGDGYMDMLVGAPLGSLLGVFGQGKVYAIFGAPDLGGLSLDSVGSAGRGFRILGPLNLLDVSLAEPKVQNFGAQIATRRLGDVGVDGDVNGDDLDDIVIGTSADGGLARPQGGVTYVLFGKTDYSQIDLLASLNDPGQRGFRINGATATNQSGHASTILGDVNGDEKADIGITAPNANAPGRADAGTAYVVWGKGPGDVDLGNLAGGGYAIRGAGGSGITSIAGPGDVNGDLTPDLLVGGAGAWLLYGKNTDADVDLASSFDGYPMTAPGGLNRASVDAVGDVDGDNAPDASVSFKQANSGAGSAFLIYGLTDPNAIDLANLPGHRGTRLDGPSGGQTGPVAGFDSGTADGEPQVFAASPTALSSGGSTPSLRPVELVGKRGLDKYGCAPDKRFKFPFYTKDDPLPFCRRVKSGINDISLGFGGKRPVARLPRCGTLSFGCRATPYGSGNAEITAGGLAKPGMLKMYDSFAKPIAALEQVSPGCFKVYSMASPLTNPTPVLNGDTVPGTFPANDPVHPGEARECTNDPQDTARIEVQGKACMETGPTEAKYWLVRLLARKGKSINYAELQGFMETGDVAVKTSQKPLLAAAYPGCGERQKRAKAVDQPLLTTDQFTTTDRYISPRALVLSANCNPTTSPTCGVTYDNYQGYPFQADLAVMTSSTTAVYGKNYRGAHGGKGGLVRAIVPKDASPGIPGAFGHSEFKRIASFKVSDANVPCGQKYIGRWTFGMANPSGDAQHKMYGWAAKRVEDGTRSGASLGC